MWTKDNKGVEKWMKRKVDQPKRSAEEQKVWDDFQKLYKLMYPFNQYMKQINNIPNPEDDDDASEF